MSVELITKAVDWWADKLQHCKQSGLSEEERRSGENHSYEMAEIMMQLNKPKVTEEQIQKFKTALNDSLLVALSQGCNHLCLSVDYHPCRELDDALIHAGISSNMGTLPIKTVMWVDDDSVRVRYGYGAEIQTL